MDRRSFLSAIAAAPLLKLMPAAPVSRFKGLDLADELGTQIDLGDYVYTIASTRMDMDGAVTRITYHYRWDEDAKQFHLHPLGRD